MKFQEIVSRLTGISTPIFGAQWQPPESEVQVAKRVITFLEDKRVLFAPFDCEFSPHCIKSVLDIRAFLTKELSPLNKKRPLALSLSAMRAACRKYIDAFPPDRASTNRWHHPHYGDDPQLFAALGELRGVFGIHIAQIAAQHGLDIEPQLATTLPGKARGF